MKSTTSTLPSSTVQRVRRINGIGEKERAEDLFERLVALRNDVGMLSEEYDPHTHQQLGNTPQAFSLVGLVNTARHLSSTRPSTSHETPVHSGDSATS